MAYETGTASSWVNLQSKIETFLTTTAGYTLTSGILTKAGTQIHVQFTGQANNLLLEMGKDSSAGSLLFKHVLMNGSQVQQVSMIDTYMGTTVSFPVNYEFFWFSTPEETFRCVIEYNNEHTQNIGFGVIEKAVAMDGGVYIDASGAADATTVSPQALNWIENSSADNGSNPLPFGGHTDSGFISFPGATQLWAEHGGMDWYLTAELTAADLGGNYSRATWSFVSPLRTGHMIEPEALNSLQTHNANNALVPIRLFGLRIDDNYSRLGDVPNMRYTNIKNRNFGEIADDGTDKWKHYPAFFKNSGSVNGSAVDSGQIGFAVRYDGP